MKTSMIGLFSMIIIIIDFFFISPFPSLQRYKTNPIIPTTHETLPMSEYRRTIETVPIVSKQQPLTSIYTFPSLIKPNNNWHQQQTRIDSTSSAWKLFGAHGLLN
jgi:hypothetical protein